jgi:Protein of unknown function (DUF3995)
MARLGVRAIMIRRTLLEHRTAYLASWWMFIFTAMSVYWALGGNFGVETLGATISTQAKERDPQFVVVLWITAVLKVLGGLLPLGMVRGWARPIPRRLLLLGTWAAGIFMILYASANFGARAIMALGLIDTPDSMRTSGARWHLWFWNSWWMLGGILYVIAAWVNRTPWRSRVVTSQSL